MSPPQSLLGIPLEVRAMITIEVVLLPHATPPSPTELHNQRRRTLPKSATGAYEETRRVMFQANCFPNPALPLLLTNRQLHAETLDTLRRTFTTAPVRYTADVVYLKDFTLWPTWLSVPIHVSHIDTLHAQFRVFNCPEGKHMQEEPVHGMFRPAPGIPAAIAWPFYHLLIGSLRSGGYGPCGIPFSVNRLVLDFLPATEEEGDILPVGPVVERRWLTASAVEEVLPEFFGLHPRLEGKAWHEPGMEAAARLMSFVLEQIDFFAKLNPGTFHLGKKLHESIGVVELRLDGEVFEMVDLGRYLGAKDAFVWWSAANKRALRRKEWRWELDFVPWKKQVERRRQELGMDVGGE